MVTRHGLARSTASCAPLRTIDLGLFAVSSPAGETLQLRKAGRAQLKAARKENREQLALASAYLDLAHAYYGNTLAESPELRRQRVTALFHELWRKLKYTERLSDFEYLLATALIDTAPGDCPVSSPEPMVTKLRMLDPRVRFALLL